MPADFFLDPSVDPRQAESAPSRGERDVDLSYLRHFRMTFELKLQGLDAEQLARRSVPPSSLSLLGLLRHLAKVEHSWNRNVLQGVDEPRLYGGGEVRDADYDGAVADEDVVQEAWTAWRREVAAAEAHLAQRSFDDVVEVHGEPTEVRDIVVHLIEEYARHCGHADLLRECIDGRTGQ
jgi:uncharacterized damage-inducible protein DinB